MVIRVLPNPREAQAYRIEKIWDGQVNSKIGRSLIECSDNGPISMFVTNIHGASNADVVATGRVFSGKVKKGDKMHLLDALTEAEVKQVFIDMGSFREEVTSISAGNLASLTLNGKVQAGETLVDVTHKEGMVPFEGINYVSEPVVTLALEPKNPKEMVILQDGLKRLAIEDPNLNTRADKDTGEYLLSGMGELHLEVAINQLKSSYGIDVSVSSPRVVYRESVQKKGILALAKSPNKLDSFWVQVKPGQEDQAQRLQKDLGNLISIDEHLNVLLDSSGKTDQVSEEALEAIIAGFEYACSAGPLAGEPLRLISVNLVDFQLGETEVSSSEIMHGVGKAIFGSFLTAEPVLLEPIYKIIITVDSELVKDSSRILSTRRGKVTSFEQKGIQTYISGYIPVSETFGLSKELRSATSGRTFWQLFFDHWERMPKKLAQRVIGELRQHKGLALEVPKPEKFLER
jgi:elongation factor 2